MRSEIAVIRGKKYNMSLCPECEVWIENKFINSHKTEHMLNGKTRCDNYAKNKDIRKRVENRLLGGK